MHRKLLRRLKREAFLTTPLSIIISPIYIIRRGLYKGISKMAPTINGDILDFGCGSKPYESLFTNATSYIGVDIESSGHNHKDSKVDIFYNGKTLPFPSDHFDAVVCFEVFEHIFNLEEVLSEIWRVMKPNGLLLISIPFAWEEHEIPYDFARYTSFGIKNIFEKNRLEIVDLEKTSTYILAICQMFITYLVQYVFPSNKFYRRLLLILIVFPLNVLSLLLNAILPKRYEYYCNIVILSRKILVENAKITSLSLNK